MPTVDEQLVAAYQEMYELTEPECGRCRAPRSCCSPEYCQMAMGIAQEEWGLELQATKHPTLPLLREDGVCVAPPHVRPLCTLHTCDVNSVGCKKGDMDWTERYFELKDRIDELEWQRHEDSESSTA